MNWCDWVNEYDIRCDKADDIAPQNKAVHAGSRATLELSTGHATKVTWNFTAVGSTKGKMVHDGYEFLGDYMKTGFSLSNVINRWDLIIESTKFSHAGYYLYVRAEDGVSTRKGGAQLIVLGENSVLVERETGAKLF